MLLIQRANESARNLQLQLERESKNRSSSFFTYLKDIFFTNPIGCDEYSLEERRKVSAYLETCLYQLSHIFEVRNVPPRAYFYHTHAVSFTSSLFILPYATSVRYCSSTLWQQNILFLNALWNVIFLDGACSHILHFLDYLLFISWPWNTANHWCVAEIYCAGSSASSKGTMGESAASGPCLTTPFLLFLFFYQYQQL